MKRDAIARLAVSQSPRIRLRAILLSTGVWAAVLADSARAILVPAVVVPSANASTEGNNNSVVPYNSGARTNQYQMTNAAMGGLPVNSVITGIQFRLDGGGTTSPATAVTWSDYEITLAQAANAIGSMSTALASNMTSPVLVKDGAYTLPAGSMPGVGTPRAFGALMAFDTPYQYLGGDLVVKLTHTNSVSGAGPTLDGVLTDAAGTGGVRALSTPVGFQMATADNTAFRFPVLQFLYTPASVPEPTSLGLLAAGAGMMLIRRRLFKIPKM